MHRETVDFGIDLGTTNSAIAKAEAADAEVIRNNLQREFTPSAVHVRRGGNIVVGERARDRVESDPKNACSEFKIQMGTRGNHKTFEDSGVAMTPEELSAEVLKSLRGDVERSTGERIEAAVITVPAAFSLDQCDATRRAAGLAGLEFAPLLQEPTAAAWAYSVRDAPSKAFWLVYDFGGGTFDAAVVKIEDGEFTVVNHAGDNFLGGKLVDWALVEEHLIPVARRDFGLASMSRDNGRAAGNLAKLKAAAENAKIELSQAEAVDIELDLTGDSGEQVAFQCELTRADVERVTRPLVERSIGMCRTALAESRTKPSDIERVLLVGGMSQAPVLRAMLADPNEGLGIRIDHSLNPVTVVAQGAAIFAGTQRIPKSTKTKQATTPGLAALVLEFAAAGQDVDPLVGGRAHDDTVQDWTGYTVELDNLAFQPPWSSGKVALRPNGAFSTRLRAQENTRNTFTITLRDRQGTTVATDPPSLTYRHADLIGAAPTLSHSISIGLSDNSLLPLLGKGTELTARKRQSVFTTVAVNKNAGTGLIRVPLVSGERPRVDRNTVIGQLELRPGEVRRDVPAGSEVEVEVSVDTSFRATAEAYVPILDEEFEIDVDLARSTAPSLADLRADRFKLEQRYDDLRDRASDVEAPEARGLLDRFDSQDTLSDVDQLLRQAEVDPDATATCQVRLRDAHTVLDEVEERLELPQIVEEARATQSAAKEVVQQAGQAEHRTALRRAESEMEAAIKERDPVLIRRQADEVRSIAVRVLDETGRLPVVIFGALEQELADHPSAQVQRLLAEGRGAINDGAVHRLAAVNAKLRPFLPDLGAGLDLENQTSTVRGGDRR
ncbi:Hsp70 family protein [Glycomyces buryatensis]|uniref:Hsp70 family protein n=1 Tax=Glycomyces buryatensis TaxID=2570927 RepID=A0A4V4HT30_9ACTN|nr:Hsp70 family protein [Glycomyces buryatensis]THV43416.1 Hsp70 family protein [Glycomyces buryatensis]